MLQQERQPVTGVVIATLAGLLRDETGNSLLGNCGRRTRPTGQREQKSDRGRARLRVFKVRTHPVRAVGQMRDASVLVTFAVHFTKLGHAPDGC